MNNFLDTLSKYLNSNNKKDNEISIYKELKSLIKSSFEHGKIRDKNNAEDDLKRYIKAKILFHKKNNEKALNDFFYTLDKGKDYNELIKDIIDKQGSYGINKSDAERNYENFYNFPIIEEFLDDIWNDKSVKISKNRKKELEKNIKNKNFDYNAFLLIFFDYVTKKNDKEKNVIKSNFFKTTFKEIVIGFNLEKENNEKKFKKDLKKKFRDSEYYLKERVKEYASFIYRYKGIIIFFSKALVVIIGLIMLVNWTRSGLKVQGLELISIQKDYEYGESFQLEEVVLKRNRFSIFLGIDESEDLEIIGYDPFNPGMQTIEIRHKELDIVETTIINVALFELSTPSIRIFEDKLIIDYNSTIAPDSFLITFRNRNFSYPSNTREIQVTDFIEYPYIFEDINVEIRAVGDFVTTKSSEIFEFSIQQLQEPRLSFSDNILSWNEVPNALEYKVIIGENSFETRDRSIDMSTLSLSDGNHTFKVQSLANNEWISSNYSSVTLQKPSAPELRVINSQITGLNPNNDYLILDNFDRLISDINNLTAGTHNLKVKIINDDSIHSEYQQFSLLKLELPNVSIKEKNIQIMTPSAILFEGQLFNGNLESFSPGTYSFEAISLADGENQLNSNAYPFNVKILDEPSVTIDDYNLVAQSETEFMIGDNTFNGNFFSFDSGEYTVKAINRGQNPFDIDSEEITFNVTKLENNLELELRNNELYYSSMYEVEFRYNNSLINSELSNFEYGNYTIEYRLVSDDNTTIPSNWLPFTFTKLEPLSIRLVDGVVRYTALDNMDSFIYLVDGEDEVSDLDTLSPGVYSVQVKAMSDDINVIESVSNAIDVRISNIELRITPEQNPNTGEIYRYFLSITNPNNLNYRLSVTLYKDGEILEANDDYTSSYIFINVLQNSIMVASDEIDVILTIEGDSDYLSKIIERTLIVNE